MIKEVQPKKDLADREEILGDPEEYTKEISRLKELRRKSRKLKNGNMEQFSTSKFFSGFNVFNPVKLAKILQHAIVTLIVIAVIVAGLIGFGYWKGRASKPILVDKQDAIVKIVDKKTGNVHKIEFKKGMMYFNGDVVTGEGMKDLKPYGIELRPKLFIATRKQPLGIGAQVAHYFEWNLDVFYLPSTTLAAGISHDIRILNMKNSSLGIYAGRDIPKQSNEFGFYWSTKF